MPGEGQVSCYELSSYRNLTVQINMKRSPIHVTDYFTIESYFSCISESVSARTAEEIKGTWACSCAEYHARLLEASTLLENSICVIAR